MRTRIFIFLLLPVCLYAQQDSLRNRPDVLRFADGILNTYAAPTRWDGKDWITFGGLLAGTVVVAVFDQPVRGFWLKQDSRFLDGAERVGYHYGKPYSAIGFTAGFYLTRLVFRNDWCKETGLLLGTTLLTSGFLQTIMKDAVGRARPETGVGSWAFKPFSRSAAYHAFPSGHAAIAFGISLVMTRRIDNVPVKILFYTLAASTAVARMYADSHWISDIGFGGMLAWFCADAAIARMKVNRFRTTPSKDKISWKVFPYPGGLTLRGSLH